MLPTHRASEMHQLYIGEVPPEDRFISPVFADFDGLPPILGQVGSTEILLDDTVRAAAQAENRITSYNVCYTKLLRLVSGTSTVVTGLAIDTPYDFQVSALDEAGNESDRTPVLTGATLPPDTQPPSQPQNSYNFV